MTNSDPLTWKVENSIESNPDAACKLIREIVHNLECAGWNDADVFAIHMALEESVMNAIKHGNRSDAKKRVSVMARIHSNHFEATVRDEGNGFCLEEIPDPTLDENLFGTSGRGVMLIKKFMDQVVWEDGGCQVVMRKNRSGQP